MHAHLGKGGKKDRSMNGNGEDFKNKLAINKLLSLLINVCICIPGLWVEQIVMLVQCFSSIPSLIMTSIKLWTFSSEMHVV